MKIKNLGKKLCIFTIILAFIVSSLFVIIINMKNNGKKTVEIAKVDNKNVIKAKDIYYDSSNYWAKDIVSEIVDKDVPIPEGYVYDKGDKNSGIIIKKKDENKYLLWIPYDEKVTTESVEEYYSKCDYTTMDSETRDSINHYGGFYINISDKEQYENLKNVTNEQYERGMKNAEKTNKEKTTEDHLISKEELAQVKSYKEKIGKEEEIITGVISTNLDVYLKTNSIISNEYGIDENSVVEFDDGTEITIPAGFDWYASERNIDQGYDIEGEKIIVLKIKDTDNPNLVYIWVPVNDNINDLKQKLADIYASVKIEDDPMYMYNWEGEDPVDTDEYKELVDSIETYKGFYMGEGELGEVTENGRTYVSNKARGMKKQDDGFLGIYSGEYYRGDNEKTNTLDKIKEIADVYSNGEKTSVKSHLTYGFEWDAVMQWIYKSKLTVSNEEQICKDSSNLNGAKYSVNLSQEITDEDVVGINGIYGLAGNLVDITQEIKRYDGTSSIELKPLDNEYIIGRGGSYSDSGDATKGGYPMASRMTLREREINAQNIGFRNCLYIVDDEYPEIYEASLKVAGNVTAELDQSEISRYIYCTEKECFILGGDTTNQHSICGESTEIVNYNTISELMYKANLSDSGTNFIAFEHANDNGGVPIRYTVQFKNEGNTDAIITPKKYSYVQGIEVWFGIDSLEKFYKKEGYTVITYENKNKERRQEIWKIAQEKEITLKPGESIYLFNYSSDNGIEKRENVINGSTLFEGYLEIDSNSENVTTSFIAYQDEEDLYKNGIEDTRNYYEYKDSQYSGCIDGAPKVNVVAEIDDNDDYMDDDGYLRLNSWASRDESFTYGDHNTYEDINGEKSPIDTQFATHRYGGVDDDGLTFYSSGDVSVTHNKKWANYEVPVTVNVKIKNNGNKKRKVQFYVLSYNYQYVTEKNFETIDGNTKHIDKKDILQFIKNGSNKSIFTIYKREYQYCILDELNNQPYLYSSQDGENYNGSMKIAECEIGAGETKEVEYKTILANQSNCTIYHRIKVLDN